jgi:methionyl-tRNA synthetase
MLLSAGLELPKRVFGHGFLTREGQKMGKSLGNVLDPEVLFNRCGPDAVRWYLLRDIPFGEDGDFQQQRFIDLVNNDLSNTIGNLLNRTITMARNWFDGCVPPAGAALETSHPLACAALVATSQFDGAMGALEFRGAAESLLRLAETANGYLNTQAPWKQMKQPGREATVGADLYAVLEVSRSLAVLLTPLVPDLAARMLSQLGQPALLSGAGCETGDGAAAVTEPIVTDPPGADTMGTSSLVARSTWHPLRQWGLLRPGDPLPEPVPVMRRLELDSPL